jgi:hypothetical protein
MRTAGVALPIIFAFVSIAAAQEEGHFDFSVSGGAAFSKTSTANSGTVSLKPTNSLVIVGGVRYRFNHLHAIELNIGHTSNSQVFTVPPNSLRVKTDITEYGGAYVLTPFRRGKLDPFLFAGLGGLRFSPGKQYIDGVQSIFGATGETALTYVYGGGTDYIIWRGLGLRVQYRGLLYKAPDFGRSILFTGARGHMAEPMAGIVVKF